LRYGASRQSVYAWKARYERDGLAGLEDRSRRPHHSPHRLAAEIEALVCELRRAHRRWGARRLVFELARRNITAVPSSATVHRALVRNGLVTLQEQHHPRKYKRWQRETPMHLWQLDLLGGLYLADGREFKLLTGIDDHSRYLVIATVLAIPNARAVCEAFTAAMNRYGVPSEVLTDNGKQFTGRFTKPRPAEVLFERICRENGITALLTKPSSPTTTGKIERWGTRFRPVPCGRSCTPPGSTPHRDEPGRPGPSSCLLRPKRSWLATSCTRRHDQPEADLRPVRDGDRHPPSAPARRHRSSDRPLGEPAGPESLLMDLGEPGGPVPVLDPRPGREVPGLLRHRLHRTRPADHRHTGPVTPGERVRAALDTLRAARVSGPCLDPWPTASAGHTGRVRRPLQPASSPPSPTTTPTSRPHPTAADH
jgi:transposase InsO family protein